jgi:uncharacterized protein YdaU (DUF1376 family)
MVDDRGKPRKRRRSRSRPRWMKFHVEDWLHGTAGLTLPQRGLYITICALIWEAEGPIPDDMARLARRAGGAKAGQCRQIVDILIEEGKIYRDQDGNLCNGRVLDELETYLGEGALNCSLEDPKSGRSTGEKHEQKQQVIDFPRARDREEDKTLERTSLSKGGVGGRVSDADPPDLEPPDKPKTKRKPEHELPADFVPDMDQARRLMDELELNRSEMNYCYQQMKGHAHATQRRQRDWNQTFANWVRKAAHDGEVGPGSRGRKGGGSAFDDEV